MSLAVSNRIWAADIGGATKLVALALADRADEHGTCWPAVPTLAARVGKSVTQVRHHLRVLQAAGVLVVTPRFTKSGRQTSNMFTICTDRLETMSAVQPERSPNVLTPHQEQQVANNLPGEGDTCDQEDLLRVSYAQLSLGAVDLDDVMAAAQPRDDQQAMQLADLLILPEDADSKARMLVDTCVAQHQIAQGKQPSRTTSGVVEVGVLPFMQPGSDSSLESVCGLSSIELTAHKQPSQTARWFSNHLPGWWVEDILGGPDRLDDIAAHTFVRRLRRGTTPVRNLALGWAHAVTHLQHTAPGAALQIFDHVSDNPAADASAINKLISLNHSWLASAARHGVSAAQDGVMSPQQRDIGIKAALEAERLLGLDCGYHHNIQTLDDEAKFRLYIDAQRLGLPALQKLMGTLRTVEQYRMIGVRSSSLRSFARAVLASSGELDQDCLAGWFGFGSLASMVAAHSLFCWKLSAALELLGTQVGVEGLAAFSTPNGSAIQFGFKHHNLREFFAKFYQ